MHLIRAAAATGAAEIAASEMAAACRDAIATRGHAVIAVSGGETPWRMLERFRTLDLPWDRVHVAQVDERIAPRSDPRRNLTRLQRVLVAEGPLPREQLHVMPVEETDVEAASGGYQRQLEALAGRPVVLDLVQLGLGTDGHTASLVPGDPVLAVRDRDAALTDDYRGLRRMTLTLPAINRARRRLWLVTGAQKHERLTELLAGTGSAPAVLVSRADALVVADAGAAGPDLRAGPYPG